MSRTLIHRGPDDQGIEWWPALGSGLAHRRLSILDKSQSGHQPMKSDDGRLAIVHNGEIYNYKEIRKQLIDLGYFFRSQSDTEVLLKSFQAWDINALARLNGIFAFGIVDAEANELILARDRLGVKPLYYTMHERGLVFASEIKAILSAGVIAEPDYPALCTPTRFQVPPHTGFKNIWKLPPGHFLRFRQGQATIGRYWDIDPCEDPAASETKTAHQLEGLLRDAVRLQLTSDVPVGILLSGGVDSSLLGALANDLSTHTIHSFTISYRNADRAFEQMPDDSRYAREVAKRFHFTHHEREITPDIVGLLPRLVWHLDEPLADPSCVNVFVLSELSREAGVPVLLSGMGGDEIFGGYRKYLACLQADVYQAVVPRFFRRAIQQVLKRLPVATEEAGLRNVRWVKRFASVASLPRFERYLGSDLSLLPEQFQSLFLPMTRYSSTLFYQAEWREFQKNGLSYLTQMCLNDTKFLLPDHNLSYNDKAAMANGVEVRPPLTDHRIVELMFRLPPAFRQRWFVQKYLLKKVAERYLPKSIVYRPKAPFGVPLRSWIRGPLAEMVGDLLAEESLKARGLYNPSYVAELVRRDREGLEDHALLIWTLLTNELWFRTFFENNHVN